MNWVTLYPVLPYNQIPYKRFLLYIPNSLASLLFTASMVAWFSHILEKWGRGDLIKREIQATYHNEGNRLRSWKMS